MITLEHEYVRQFILIWIYIFYWSGVWRSTCIFGMEIDKLSQYFKSKSSQNHFIIIIRWIKYIYLRDWNQVGFICTIFRLIMYMVVHGNLHAGVTLVSKKTKTNKNYLMGHVAPSHPQGHHPRPYLPVSTARLMTAHPLDASTGNRPWIKPQRPDPVTGCRDNGPNSGHAATCPITVTTQLHTATSAYFSNNSHTSVELKHTKISLFIYF